MNRQTAFASAVVTTVTVTMVTLKVRDRRNMRKFAALKETVDTMNEMMNKQNGTTDVEYVSLPME